jgi:hypothetical protein
VDRESGYGKRPLLGCLLIIVLVALCGGVTTFTLDRLCLSTMTQRLPIYPGAQTVVERHNSFTEFGMGETYVELYSPDAADVVSKWYGNTAGTYQINAVRNDDPIYNLARSNWTVNKAEDGKGSQIQLYGTCVN